MKRALVLRHVDHEGIAGYREPLEAAGYAIERVAAHHSGCAALDTLSPDLLVVMVSYGDWGQGIFKDKLESISAYFNDELKIGDNLHIDFGARYEHVKDRVDIGNQAAVNPPVPAGTPGLIPTLGASFDGTYTRQEGSYDHLAATAGINYTLTRNFSVYARYARGFQTSAGDNGGVHLPANLTLYEAGVRFQSRMLPWL